MHFFLKFNDQFSLLIIEGLFLLLIKTRFYNGFESISKYIYVRKPLNIIYLCFKIQKMILIYSYIISN